MAGKSAARTRRVESAPEERTSSVSDAKPRKSFDQVEQAGLAAYELAVEYRDKIEERLEAGLVDGVSHDLSELGVAVPNAKQAREDATAATSTQSEALAHGHALASAVHLAIKRRHAPRDVRRAYGVGTRVDPRSATSVQSAIGLILDRAAAKPDEARRAGILARDLSTLRAVQAEIRGAKGVKDQKKANAPRTTRQRNIIAQRVLAAVEAIAAAGALEFANNPVERARFEALLSRGNRKRGAKPAAAGANAANAASA